MKSLKKIAELADRFESKISQAQQQGAQAGDIENALKKAGAWPDVNEISTMLPVAKVPDNVALNISLIVDSRLSVKFAVDSNPPHASAAVLGKLLERKYSPKMTQALKAAQVAVTDTVTAKLANFA